VPRTVHRPWLVAAGAVVVFATAMIAARAARRPAPLSRETLAEAFDAGMRNIVIEWDAADPRPNEERRRALFDFVHQTYRASAWIPQSLFDGNLAAQAVAGDVDTIVGEKVGLVLWRGNRRVRAFGMAPNAGTGEPLRWTVNCLVCHTAQIDGVVYFGAGTKTFDELWLGEALKRLTSERWRGLVSDGADATLAADANRILNAHHHDRIDSLTRARSTAFAASHVELYMRTHGGAMPSVDRRGSRRRQNAAALAHGGQDDRKALVQRRQLSRSVSADGIVDGARERSSVRRARRGRHSRHQR